MDLQIELETAIAAARKASTAILDFYALDILTEEKFGTDNHSEPVTAADRESSRIIVEAIRTAFPNDAILSEEETDLVDERLSSDRVWIIDPIDGTWGFIRKDDDFAVQIGLAVEGEPVLGVVLLPVRNTLYYASLGRGAYVVIGNEPEKVLHVSEKTDPLQMIVATSRNHQNPGITKVNEYFGFAEEHQRGSIGLKVGLIAEQICDVYINLSPRSKFWDTCGPQIILEEAGGTLTDLFGEKIRYDARDVQNYGGVVAAGGSAHGFIIEKLRPFLNEIGRHKIKAKAGS